MRTPKPAAATAAVVTAKAVTTPWTLPTTLKRTQLQRIATSIGAPISGTKPQLLSGIHELVTRSPPPAISTRQSPLRNEATRELRVLSIDMGIRNLAFAFLTCAVTAKTESKKDEVRFGRPELRSWRKVELFDVGDAFESTGKHKSTTKPNDDTTLSVPLPLPQPDDPFDPPNLAKYAYIFAKHCASLNPTHILIERQRFRTAGHAAVLEWSLRVGMLESMLHATFHTLEEENILSDVSVEPVLPIRVNKFWFADQDEAEPRDLRDTKQEKETQNVKKAAKLAKIAIVKTMLTKHDSFTVHRDAKPTVDAFLSVKGTRRSTAEKDLVVLEKLDDVADSLLQGLAWLKWRENRARLLANPAIRGDLDTDSFFKS